MMGPSTMGPSSKIGPNKTTRKVTEEIEDEEETIPQGSSVESRLLGGYGDEDHEMTLGKTYVTRTNELKIDKPSEFLRKFRNCFWRREKYTSRTLELPIEERDQRKRRFPPNVIRNQKYTIFSFLFIILYEQFRFFFNLYFLLVALSQTLSVLQIGYRFTYIAPLTFVLMLTIGKEAWDDYIRFKRDKEANSQLYQKLTRQGLLDISSANIRVGDLLLVERNQRVPADMLLLRTTEQSGSCFIRTDQLDGETDWKLR